MTNDELINDEGMNKSKIQIGKLVIGASFVIMTFLIGTFAQASQVLDPTDIGVGARPLGLGKAYTAIANDGSAIFTNPAGMAQSKGLKLISMAGSLLTEIPYTVIGGSYPVLNGVMGIGYVGLGVSGIKETIIVNGTPEITGNDGSYTNTAINISYAQDLPNNIAIFKDPKVGATLKLISQGFTGTSSFEAGKGSGFDIDLGAIANINEDMTAGLMLKNIMPGNNLGKDEIPMVIQTGITKTFKQYNLLTAIDLELSRTMLFHLGAEWSPMQLLKLRLGFDQKPSAGSTITNLAAGLGINFKGFTVDYAYHTYAELAEFTTHFISIGFCPDGKGEEVKPVLAPLPSNPPVIEIKTKKEKTPVPTRQIFTPKKAIEVKSIKKR